MVSVMLLKILDAVFHLDREEQTSDLDLIRSSCNDSNGFIDVAEATAATEVITLKWSLGIGSFCRRSRC